jgi:phenylacetate-CoA ligase
MRFRDLLTLRRLRTQQWKSPGELLAIQNRKLQALIAHAYRQVPYYRDLFDEARVRPSDIRTAQDLARIPISTRRQIQSLPSSSIVAGSANPDDCMQLTTSGSSGMPLRVFLRQKDCAVYDMIWVRTALADGQSLWDKTAAFKFNSRPQRWFQRMGIWRKDIVSMVDDLDVQIEALQRGQPQILRGNAFQLVDVAREVDRQGLRTIRPRLVYSLGSLLSDNDRALIEYAFGAPVFDFYGSTEFGCMGWECPSHEGFHLNIDTTVFEFIKEGRPAKPGEMAHIVCTSLYSRAMPFIRYDTGDVGVLGPEPCSCGRGLPLMTELNGRADDFFLRPDGSSVSPSVLVNRVKTVPGLIQFRATQHRNDHIAVDVVTRDSPGDDVCDGMAATIREIMRDPITLDFRRVDAIEAEASGKIRSMISLLDREAL